MLLVGESHRFSSVVCGLLVLVVASMSPDDMISVDVCVHVGMCVVHTAAFESC